jgi:hypothetical protein
MQSIRIYLIENGRFRFLLIILTAVVYCLLLYNQREKLLSFRGIANETISNDASAFRASLDLGFPSFAQPNVYESGFLGLTSPTKGAVEVKLDSIDWSGYGVNADKICLTYIGKYWMWEEERDSYRYSFEQQHLGPSVCRDLDVADRQWIIFSESEVQIKPFYIPARHDLFLFPYDDVNVQLLILFGYELFKDNKRLQAELVTPQLYLQELDVSEWQVEFTSVVPSPLVFEESEHMWINNLPGKGDYLDVGTIDPLLKGYDAAYTSILSVTLTRPWIYRFVYPFLTVSLMVFIALLSTVNTIDSFVEGSIAVLFGIFGLREIFIPEELKLNTAADFIILGLYVVFAIAVILQIMRLFSTRHSPSILGEGARESEGHYLDSHKSKDLEGADSRSSFDREPGTSTIETTQYSRYNRPANHKKQTLLLIWIGVTIFVSWFFLRPRRHQ